MAFTTNKETTTTERTYIDIARAEVRNARVLSPTNIVFTLRLPGLSLYNMRVVQDKKGAMFIAPPSTKGNDGNYYKQYAVYIADHDLPKLIAKVIEAAGVEIK